MSRFEKEGVSRQYGAMTIAAAKSAFNYSCYKCSITGRRNNCQGCAIANAHKDVITFVLS